MIVAGIACGLVGAEGLLRLLVPMEIQFETWFTPGVHEYDEDLGYRYKPGYAGWMRHRDRLWVGERLQLDKYGFRPCAKSDLDGEARRVLLLGGRSVLMNYGVPERDTIHGLLAGESAYPLEVHNAALAGWDLYQNWIAFRLGLDNDEPFDLAVVSIYMEEPDGYARLKPHQYEATWPAPPPEEVFKYMDGVRLWPKGLIAEVGPVAYQSYVLYGFLRAAGLVLRQLGCFPEVDAVAYAQAHPPSADAITGFGEYLAFIESHLEAKGTRVLFLFPPRMGFPEKHFEALYGAIPAGSPFVDLHREFSPDSGPEDWIANDHYSAEFSARITERLRGEVDRWLGEGGQARRPQGM